MDSLPLETAAAWWFGYFLLVLGIVLGMQIARRRK